MSLAAAGLCAGALSAQPRARQENSSIWPKMTSTVFLWQQLFNSRGDPRIPRNSYFPVDLDHLVC